MPPARAPDHSFWRRRLESRRRLIQSARTKPTTGMWAPPFFEATFISSVRSVRSPLPLHEVDGAGTPPVALPLYIRRPAVAQLDSPATNSTSSRCQLHPALTPAPRTIRPFGMRAAPPA
jgi:hypothetical protein